MDKKKETGELTSHGQLSGNKYYQKCAREALPILVRQAKAEQLMYYSSLAAELGMLNPRNLNYVLGTIGNALVGLSRKWKKKIPPIQCLVVNKQTGIPGAGIAWFVDDINQFKRSSTKQKRLIIQRMLTKVFSFDEWDDVLQYFALSSSKNPVIKLKPVKSVHKYGGSGESEEHRKFKAYLAKRSHLFGISSPNGETEFEFASGDCVDILFKTNNLWLGIEAKSKKSSSEDITRGLFQCIKYRVLIEATQMVEQMKPNARVILAMEDKFPHKLLWLKNTLGVEVIDNIVR